MEDSPYLEFRESFLAMTEVVLDLERSSYPILAPTDVAEVVYKAATAKRPRTRYRVGLTARLMPALVSLRGDRGIDRMMLKAVADYRE